MFSQAPHYNSGWLFLEALVAGSWLGAVRALCALFGFPVNGMCGWRDMAFVWLLILCLSIVLQLSAERAAEAVTHRSSTSVFINVLLSSEPKQAEQQWDVL